jgi:hypothetical protein
MQATVEPREVWLRGNLRPVAGMALLAAALVGIALGLAAAIPLPAWGLALVGVAGGTLLFCLGWLAWFAGQPRLVRRGQTVEVRLAPLKLEQVPLGVIECVFRGTEPVAEADGVQPRFRVGTLVLRLAERATEWRSRQFFGPWGSWEDGHIVIDGRWCEPLSAESARQIATRLAEVKRELAAGGAA